MMMGINKWCLEYFKGVRLSRLGFCWYWEEGMGLMKEFIGANSKIKRRGRRGTAAIWKKESMASLWHSWRMSTREIEAITSDLSKALNLRGSQFFHLSIWRTGYWNQENVVKHFEFFRRRASPSYILWVKENLLLGRNACGMWHLICPKHQYSDVFGEGSNQKHLHRKKKKKVGGQSLTSNILLFGIRKTAWAQPKPRLCELRPKSQMTAHSLLFWLASVNHKWNQMLPCQRDWYVSNGALFMSWSLFVWCSMFYNLSLQEFFPWLCIISYHP